MATLILIGGNVKISSVSLVLWMGVYTLECGMPGENLPQLTHGGHRFNIEHHAAYRTVPEPDADLQHIHHISRLLHYTFTAYMGMAARVVACGWVCWVLSRTSVTTVESVTPIFLSVDGANRSHACAAALICLSWGSQVVLTIEFDVAGRQSPGVRRRVLRQNISAMFGGSPVLHCTYTQEFGTRSDSSSLGNLPRRLNEVWHLCTPG
ncbi:hypothetical protein BU16DRAFT_247838 [Lophium mytilinum]|uniref:Uncharacterized protein n=1 Tax=Lophium mytilinum TaxID=390894 RepID=A0A6A6R7W5_9PEZI|nr:hypothetical protein BU16DRAFT_247838 [Lophium mytilinum]